MAYKADECDEFGAAFLRRQLLRTRRRRSGGVLAAVLSAGLSLAGALVFSSPGMAQQGDAPAPTGGQAPADSVEALNKRAEELFTQGKYAESLAVAEEGARAAEQGEAAKGKPGAATAVALNNVAWRALFARRYDRALEAAGRAESLFPGYLPAAGNRAYALMFSNRADEAQAVLTEHKGETIPGLGKWEDVVSKDFDEFQKQGLGHPRMTRLAKALVAAPESANALLMRGLGLFKANKYGDAVEAFARCAAAVKERNGVEHPAYAQAITLQTRLLQMLSRHAEAEPLVRQLLAINEKRLGPDAPPIAGDLDNLAAILRATNRLAEAEPLYRRSLAINKKNFGPEDAHVARDLDRLATLLRETSRFDEAEKLARRALAIDEKQLGPEHGDVASDLTTLALILKETHKLEEAEPLVRRALAINEKSFGADDFRIVAALNNLALILQETGRTAEAEPPMRRSHAVLEKAFGPEHPAVATALNNLAMLLQVTNRLAEAEPLMRRVLAIHEKTSGPEHPATAVALNNLAQVLQAAGRYAEAEPLMRRVLTIDETSYGPDHPSTAIAVNNLGQLFQTTNRYAEAEPLYRRALAINEKAFGPDSPQAAGVVNNLAALFQETNRFAEAEALARRALAAREKSHGPDHPDVAISLTNLAQLLRVANRFAEAEPLMRRALAIDEKSQGPEHSSVAIDLNNLALFFQTTNRHAEAEPLYRRALAINEKSYGREHPSVARTLNNLAQLLKETNRYAEAEPLYRRALAVDEKSFGADHTSVATDLNNLAEFLLVTNHSEEAEPLLHRALVIDEKSFGPEHTNVARDLNNLAALLAGANRHNEAEPLYRRTLAIDEKRYGSEHAEVALDLNNLARNLQDAGHSEQAEPLYRRALAIYEQNYGPDHPSVALVLDNLASLLDENSSRYAEAKPLHRRALDIEEKSYGAGHSSVAQTLGLMAWFQARQGDWPGALQSMRRSTAIRIENARRMRNAGGDGEKRLLSQSAEKFKDHALMAYRAAHGDAAARDEAFAMAQRAAASEAAGALALASARFASGNDALAALAREQQDLARQRDALDRRLIEALGKPDRAAAEAARAKQSQLDARLNEIAARLAKDYPDYVALINPEPLTVAAAQALLAPDEALIQFLDLSPRLKGQIPGSAFAFVIAKTEARWLELPIGALELADRVAALRCGLDSSAWRDMPARCTQLLDKTASELELPPFDLARAYGLYRDLFGQVENLIKDKRLLIAPTGALTQLPFQVLATQAPAPAASDAESYAKAQWLGVRQAITVLPSAASLRILRLGRQGSASEPFAGFGNPLLKGKNNDNSAWERQDCKRALSLSDGSRSAGHSVAQPLAGQVRGGEFRSAVADVDSLRQAPPLPETADELCLVARNLGAPETAVYLGERATVSQIKALSASGALARARTIHFATHGLLADETAMFVAGNAEPALLLTPPAKDKAGADDDGLLRASDVTQLKLNADWVVMSACNTAAGGAAGGESLSGLAQAFFYAGARSLLVSHWYLRSDAAVDITTGTFAALKSDPQIGRAEALRRSLAALIAKGGQNAHPAVWGPLVLVGEGGRPPATATTMETVDKSQKNMALPDAAPAMGALTRRLKYKGSGRLVAFAPDGRRLAVGGAQGVKVWDAGAGAETGFFTFDGKSSQTINALVFSGDGRRLLAATPDDSVTVWDVESGQPVRKFPRIAGASKSFTFSADGRLLAAVVGAGTAVNVWDMESGQLKRAIAAGSGRSFSREAIVLSRDGRRLAIEQYSSSEPSPAVSLWDVGSGGLVHVFKRRQGDIHALAFTEDGGRLAVAGSTGAIVVWDTRTARMTFTASGPATAAKLVAFSHDGRFLAAAGAGHGLRLWDLQTNKPAPTIASQADAVTSLVFSPNGRLLASGGDGAIELWEAAALTSAASSNKR